MPIYEYLCKAGHRVELVQRFADAALTACEICGKPAQRVLHAPALHFKGKGFYATDYGTRKGGNGDKPDGAPSESGAKEAAASSSSGSGSDGSASSQSESKGSDSKSSDAKGSDSKRSDAKRSSSEGSSARKADSKPAA